MVSRTRMALFAPSLAFESERVAFPPLGVGDPIRALTVDDDANDLARERISPPEVSNLDPSFWQLRVSSQPASVERGLDLVPERKGPACPGILGLCEPRSDEVLKI